MEKRLNQSIVFLKQRHNQCLPIGRLSDEILLAILQYCVGQTKPVRPSYYSSRITYQARSLPAAFVCCSRWRSLAIRSPSLWATIGLPSPPKLFQLLRDRSGTSSLTVIASNDHYAKKDAIMDFIADPLRQLVPRIARLEMAWEKNADDPDGLNGFLSTYIGGKEFSNLRALDLTDLRNGPEPSVTLNAPGLRSFRYRGELRHLPKVEAARLVDLHLVWQHMTLPEILKVLSRFPNLKNCTIDQSGCTLKEPVVHATRSKVALGRMRSFDAKTFYTSDMIYLFEHLELPDSASVSLEIHSERTEEGSPLIDLLGPQIALADGIKISGDHSMEIKYTLLRTSSGQFQVVHQKSSNVIFESPSNLADYPSSLSSLEFHVRRLPSMQDLITILTYWSSLTHIRVCTEELSFEKLLTALEETPQTVCPELQSLDCTGTKFSGPRMRVWLAFRKQRGVGLKELTVTKGFAEPKLDDINDLVEMFFEEPPERGRAF
ncbi:hypothetical protein SISSUDRAFT_1044248 [Sistotremastrum suecicum HHB10207 ss-3]|uniref:F-box domain-containing protein n=1 Tax=Sistotremastrum suecicum HHB10207 ss-3 TaxID=1314776 RepID=A0A166F7H8_9AGAM|nr:hypothetical protein SISSUDRAFT_1044248 [Sistotremastrum suecicum HHB10207 ss-3]